MHVSYIGLVPFTANLFLEEKNYFAAYLLFFTNFYLHYILHLENEIGTSSSWIDGFYAHISCTHFTPYK